MNYKQANSLRAQIEKESTCLVRNINKTTRVTKPEGFFYSLNVQDLLTGYVFTVFDPEDWGDRKRMRDYHFMDWIMEESSFYQSRLTLDNLLR